MTSLVKQDQLKNKMRSYSKTHRESWNDLGFRSMSALIHDDDREYMLTEIEVVRAARMCAIADNKETPRSVLTKLAARNITKLPLAGELLAATDAANESENKAAVLEALSTATYYKKKYNGAEIRYRDAYVDKTTQVVVHLSQLVAYSSAAAAYFRRATFLLNEPPAQPLPVDEPENISAVRLNTDEVAD